MKAAHFSTPSRTGLRRLLVARLDRRRAASGPADRGNADAAMRPGPRRPDARQARGRRRDAEGAVCACSMPLFDRGDFRGRACSRRRAGRERTTFGATTPRAFFTIVICAVRRGLALRTCGVRIGSTTSLACSITIFARPCAGAAARSSFMSRRKISRRRRAAWRCAPAIWRACCRVWRGARRWTSGRIFAPSKHRRTGTIRAPD